MQSTKVEAIGWTGSGDGIIACGLEVVLWRRSNRFWEVAWKFKVDQPQALVSATWSIQGLFAISSYADARQTEGLVFDDLSKCVHVCLNDEHLGFNKTRLSHPLPISMIQWRPLKGEPSNTGGGKSERNFLLTCCVDGTVRLWCEIDNGRVRKGNDHHKATRRSFCVAAVIEVNQSMRGILGVDVFVTWSMEIDDMFESGEGVNASKGNDFDNTGSCAWIIGFGPRGLVSLWAVHCLDDVSPMRYPRVTLWKSLELEDSKINCIRSRPDLPNSQELFIRKAIVLRNNVSSSPTTCSFIKLLPSNSLVWTLLHPQNFNTVERQTQNDDNTSCSTVGYLNLDGHTGKILQVAAHPYNSEVELAASIDSNGLLIFWSLSTVSNYDFGQPTLIPAWEIFGKLETRDSCSKYTTLRWVPAVLDGELFLLMGHVVGIDLFMVKYPTEDENLVCHYLCTIPFTGHGPFEEGPTDIFSIPLPVTANGILTSKFMLLGVWISEFQALSWEITLHSCDLPGNCCSCNFDSKEATRITFSGKRYCVIARTCSSQFPETHKQDHVTSFAVVCRDNLVSQTAALSSDQFNSTPAYTMATGCANGFLKLWRSKIGETQNSADTLWELVGICATHRGPISTVCLSDSGGKVVTICKEFCSNSVNTLSIWEAVHIAGSGLLILEDTIALDEQVVALSWLSLSDGQLLLGVCFENQLCIYSQLCLSSRSSCGGQILLNSGKSLKGDIWRCIAFARTSSPIKDYFWGPRATAVVIHDHHLSVISQWSFLAKKQPQGEVESNCYNSNRIDFASENQKNIHSEIFADCDIGNLAELSIADSAQWKFVKDMKKGSSLSAEMGISPHDCLGAWSILEVAEKLGGSLPEYHPEALLMNVFTGIKINSFKKRNSYHFYSEYIAV